MQWENLPQGLMGMGAWFQGQGPEWESSQKKLALLEEERRLKQEEARKLAWMQDNRVLLHHVKNKNYGAASSLLGNRLDSLKQLDPNADTSHTDGLVGMLDRGEYDDMVKGLKALDDEAVIRGKLDAMPLPEPPTVVSQKNVGPQGGVIMQDKDRVYRQQVEGWVPPEPGEGSDFAASAKTELFDNGASIMALPDGRVVVKDPEGNVVTGKKRILVLKKANQHKIDMAGKQAGTEAAAKSAIEISTDSYRKLDAMGPAIANIDKAIAAIDDGAATGTIVSLMPSFRTSSKTLDNVAKRMGLDVVATGNFGPLNESELKIAMAVAVPMNLSPPELRDWLVKRKDAQIKLAEYLGDAAIYLGTPGNTITEWLEIQKNAPTGYVDQSGQPITMEEIRYTAQKHGMSVDEVITRGGFRRAIGGQ